ncbi:restriction endonuclease [Ligilactobacillus salivarius]|uniref:EcoRI family type II restriction endonuclease n=1 Tax=Ligilactobacillus salivarius TaxID=1624 RepID=UPI00195EB5DB|nr:EcoRI family type II restriction endonuclease [Ligilactobacillus salivarius]MBM6956983.1 restriction endonuclease [Ligilactobacillus salivarius]
MVNRQSDRLKNQQEESKGVLGIFGTEAKHHDLAVNEVSKAALKKLEEKFPQLTFRYRDSIRKEEINKALNKIDSELGRTLFVTKANIKPDGGIIEVKDDEGEWRVILVTEAKYQGKDIDNIKAGILVGKNKDQDTMVAGNAIERSHKNISEIANFMLTESYFPYVIFLEGTNFLTKNISVTRPDGRVVVLNYNSGSLNRLDRLSAANYGMPFNKNLCRNKFVKGNDGLVMLQAASMYTTGDGSRWDPLEMYKIMLEIAETSLKMLGSDIFKQLTKG